MLSVLVGVNRGGRTALSVRVRYGQTGQLSRPRGSRRSISCALVRPETIRSSTPVSHAKGSTPLSLAVATRLATIVQCRVPPVRAREQADAVSLVMAGAVWHSSYASPTSRTWPARYGSVPTLLARVPRHGPLAYPSPRSRCRAGLLTLRPNT